MGICYVRPAGDLVDATGILQCNCVPCLLSVVKSARSTPIVTNICEFSVFKNDETMFGAKMLQFLDQRFIEIFQYIDMCLK